MYVFVSLPEPTQMSEQLRLEGKHRIYYETKTPPAPPPETFNYHENTGGSNGSKYSKQWHKSPFNLIIYFYDGSRFH